METISQMSSLKALIIALVMAILSSIALVSAVAAAPPGLSIKGTIVQRTLHPGETYVHTMTVTSNSDYPMEMHVEASGFGQGPEGATQAVSADMDDSPLTARAFISHIDPPAFHLEPGESQEVNVTIDIPADAAPGQRYAIIHVASDPGGSSGVGVIIGTDIPVILTIPGAGSAELAPEGIISDLTVGEIESGKPIQVTTSLKNTGSVMFKAKNRVTLLDDSGNVISRVETPLCSPSLLPTFIRRFETAHFVPDSGLIAGDYAVESEILFDDHGTPPADDGAPLVLKKAQFTIETDYIPTTPEPVIVNDEPSAQPDSAPDTDGKSASGIGWPLFAIIVGIIVLVSAVTVVLLIRRRGTKAV